MEGEELQVPFSGIVGGPGLLEGIVLQNTPDPGRPARGVAKVYIPHIHGPVQPPPSALPEACVSLLWGGLAGLGLVAIPPVNSTVIVGFIMGDVEKPIVLGQVYGAEGLPAEAQAASPPDSALTIQHPSGWVVKLDFAAGRFEVRHPSLNSIVLDEEGVKLSKAGELAAARLIHEFGVDTFTGAPLGEATQGATAAVKASQSPQ